MHKATNRYAVIHTFLDEYIDNLHITEVPDAIEQLYEVWKEVHQEEDNQENYENYEQNITVVPDQG